MKTTLVIDDGVFSRLKAEAARRKLTMSALVESALRSFLRTRSRRGAKLPSLPRFDGGNVLVDIADRDALYRAMEDR
jgi:hypothetical protein